MRVRVRGYELFRRAVALEDDKGNARLPGIENKERTNNKRELRLNPTNVNRVRCLRFWDRVLN